ncbi:MAG: thioredoxin family protein [Acidiferrobacterales bacterium]
MPIAGYLLIAAGIVFFVLQAMPFVRARIMHGKPAPRCAGMELPAGERALVYFFSKSCGMCRPMTPRIEQFARNHPNVFLIDVAEAPELARRFAVMGTPTTVLVRDGKVERIWVGALSPARLCRVFENR